MSRKETIQRIIDQRKPMADRAAQEDGTLYQIEGEIRKFKEFSERFSSQLGLPSSESIKALEPELDHILERLSIEKSKLSSLCHRFTRSTLNLGVVGPARNGKSTWLQQITGLSSDEIPSGNKGHLTGAPSFICHRDSDSTEAELQFFTETEFLNEVIAPYYLELRLGNPPTNLQEFRNAKFTTQDDLDTTEQNTLKKLVASRDSLDEFSRHLDGGRKSIQKNEIREWIAQEGVPLEGENPPLFHKWRAVKVANIYCRFGQDDIGSVTLSDTPGLGDFISGAEERLAKLVARDLDAVIFVRMPEAHGPIVRPPDTNLYGLITRSIPEFSPKDWTYYIINKTPENSGNLDHFESDLTDKKIETRHRYRVDGKNRTESLGSLDSILSDLALNLGHLDRELYEKRIECIEILKKEIADFAERAANALPSAGMAQPDLMVFNPLFKSTWMNLGSKSADLVEEYRNVRNQPDQDFLQKVEEIFSFLEQGPGLPEPEEIKRQADAHGLTAWHAHKLNALRVQMSNAFETIDEVLKAGHDAMRAKVLAVLCDDDGGNLANLESKTPSWNNITTRWKGLPLEHSMIHAFELLLTSHLSFRGFIQPRVRECLDVLDERSKKADPFRAPEGDGSPLEKAGRSREKLKMAWDNAAYKARAAIEEMAFEPNMARFAALEDFRGTILHTDGEGAREAWHLFYLHSRAEVWPTEFAQLEADTQLRKEWDEAVNELRSACANI